MNKLLIAAASVLACIIIALAFAGDYFYGEAVQRGTEVDLHSEEEIPVTISEENIQLLEDAAEWYEEQEFEEVSMESHDGLLLAGDFLRSEDASGKAVILVHGFRGEREEMGDFVQFYHEQGFDVLIPDARGHGQSEGDYMGFGWHDRLDLVQWTELLVEEMDIRNLLLHGHSMGAAAVLMAGGEELPAEVAGIVADSGYTSANDILSYQLKHIYGLPAFPLIPVTSGITRIRSGFSFEEASALKQTAKNERPLLLIHGERDELVPISMSREIHEAAGNQSVLWTVPDAGHVKSYTVATGEYQERLEEFIGEHVRVGE
ncbi:MAG TPA: alpha/beta hydrolase [Planococcus sp. (in: firmicutes)]|nr:alpha/beta hydrolase [Planococcus sp. (in: firmicutes)]